MNRFSLLPAGTFAGARQALVDSIAADERSAEIARACGNTESVERYKRGADMGRRALARHDAQEPASGVRRSPTMVGVAPPAPRSAPTPCAVVPPHPTTYSFVASGRRR